MKLRYLTLIGCLLAVLFVSLSDVSAQTKKVTIKFRPGTSGATYNNSVTGYGTVEFYIAARAGQTMSVKLISPNRFMYFNILASPDAREAMSPEAREVTEFSGELPADGKYVVEVYLVRAEARRNKRPVKFKLQVDIE